MNVVFYEKEDGTIPIVEFLDSLDAKMYAKDAFLMDEAEAACQQRMPEPLRA